MIGISLELGCWCLELSELRQFFEFLHAGLPIISNNIPEQRRIIDQFGCGWVVGDQEELSRLVRSISPDSISEKLSAVSEAKESNSWANEKDMIVDTYSRVMASRR